MIHEKEVSFEVNPARFNYILELFGLSKEEFITLANGNRKRDLLTTERLDKILNREEKVNAGFLKRVDKIFHQGLTWYITKRDLPDKENSSIFFRKNTFNTRLNLESKIRISKYEDLKFEIQTLCKDIGFEPKRLLEKYRPEDNPKDAARAIRSLFDEKEKQLIDKKLIASAGSDRDYLKNLIRVIEQFNVFVFEFVDRNKKPEKKISFNGFFLSPNVIAIKRQQKYLKREIFTLIHEFAHYLLNQEEIDDNTETLNPKDLSRVEYWCNTFAFYFLLGRYEANFSRLKYATAENNYYANEVDAICNKTHVSKYAIYTRLRIEDKISPESYNTIKKEIDAFIRKQEIEKRLEYIESKEAAEEKGEKFSPRGPKEIESNLFKEILRINYFEGKINENQLRQHLKISSNKSIDEVIY